VGTGRRIHDGWDVAVLSIGPIGNDVEQAIQQIETAESPSTKDHCPSVAHYDMRFLKPLDEKILEEVATRFSRIVTIEDGVRNGGLGSAVTEWMNDHGYSIPITRMGLPDNFVEHGTVQELKQICGIDVGSIKKVLTSEKG
jgi:1-deoxy-D-xylulose-5-phosphate synthase